MNVDVQIDLSEVADDNDCMLLSDKSDVRTFITVNNEDVLLDNIEFDKKSINIITDGHIIPDFIIDMIKEDRIKEAKHEIEKLGL